MAVISFCSAKGGVGKSTAAINLAVYFQKQNKSVYLIDADADVKSSSKWLGRRKKEKIKGTQATGDLLDLISEIAPNYDYVIIDNQGKNDDTVISSLVCSDFCIANLKPSYFDSETIPEITKVVKRSQHFNPKLKMKMLINGASTNKAVKEAQEVEALLNELNLERFETILHERKAYRDTLGYGEGVLEIEKPNGSQSKALDEINHLGEEVLRWNGEKARVI